MVRLSCEGLSGGVGDARRVGRRRRWSAAMGLALIALPLWLGGLASGGESGRATDAQLKLGEELFNREWTPNDPRCHGGDGLGPVYNKLVPGLP
jgi:hypothetical protein